MQPARKRLHPDVYSQWEGVEIGWTKDDDGEMETLRGENGLYFQLPFAMMNWPSQAWVVLASFCEALADDAAYAEEAKNADLDTLRGGAPVEETALDAWVRSVETEHGWRKVNGDG